MVERNTNDPLNYLGVRASTPPNLVRENRTPLVSDTKGPDGPFVLGDLWLDPTAPQLYVLVNTASGIADWKSFGL